MKSFLRIFGCFVLVVIGAFVFHPSAYATHSWGGYHWARTANPFTLKAGDNLTSAWKPFLATTVSDWSTSNVLDMTVVPGQARANCKGTSGRDEICNKAYGKNGWLGIAQIMVSGLHITAGTVKVNDTYFNTADYNKPAWKNLVMCQEVGHTLGLDHQDETFTNTNLGTCMDYTNDPDGTIYNQLDNEHPNAHDYEELGIVYAHLDSMTTVGQTISRLAQSYGDEASENAGEWGRLVRQNGHLAVFEKDFGGGNKQVTFVIFAD